MIQKWKCKVEINFTVTLADFATGIHKDTQTCFYMVPLIVKCIFAYNIFVLDVIRLTENIGQYHSRPMRDVHGDKHAYMHVHIHARIHA